MAELCAAHRKGFVMKAKAIVIVEPGKVDIWEYDVPALRAGEVLVETSHSGVSQGTEIWDYVGKRVELKYPNVPGYQSIGRVIDAAPDVDRTVLGKRVRFLSSRLEQPFTPSWMNCHVSHAVLKDYKVVPEDVDPVEAAISAMPSVSLRGVRMLNFKIGDLVVVNGQGLIGQGSAQLAKLHGAVVVASDPSPLRRELSAKFSADYVVDPRETDLVSFVKELKPAGADIVIEATGRSDMFKLCVDLLRWEGQILLQGFYPDPITFNFNHTHGKKPTIAVTCGTDDDPIMFEFMRRRQVQYRELVTHVASVADAPALYERMAKADPSIVGVVFDWGKS
ncbi:MAG: zinc-binding alcohol dehydrogenase [Capsulimonadaceae bacterium]|nr:zinc-binding alcohol dehydrogenase [Capsulimonadaceae bacterium]